MTVSCYSNCSPMVPDITINQTLVQLDGNTTLWHSQLFEYADADIATRALLHLESIPVADATVKVARGATILRPDVDYTIEADYITLTTPMTAGEQVLVDFISVTGVTSASTRGTIMGLGGTVAPSGWLIMENTTPYAGVAAGSTYHSLYEWLQDNLPSAIDTAKTDATNFYFVATFVNLYVGGVFSTVPAIIKT